MAKYYFVYTFSHCACVCVCILCACKHIHANIHIHTHTHTHRCMQNGVNSTEWQLPEREGVNVFFNTSERCVYTSPLSQLACYELHPVSHNANRQQLTLLLTHYQLRQPTLNDLLRSGRPVFVMSASFTWYDLAVALHLYSCSVSLSTRLCKSVICFVASDVASFSFRVLAIRFSNAWNEMMGELSIRAATPSTIYADCLITAWFQLSRIVLLLSL